MKLIRTHGWFIAVLLLIGVLYRHWFAKGMLSAPDFPFIFPSQYADFVWQPSAWSNLFANGMGSPGFDILNLDTYLRGIGGTLLNGLGIPWNLVYRIVFFWPFLALSAFGSYYLGNILLKRPAYAAIAALIYCTNTYVLMLAGGGQAGLMVAYGVVPFVIGAFIEMRPLPFTVALSSLLLFDLRYFVLVAVAMIGYTLMVTPRSSWLRVAVMALGAGIVSFLLHSFWLVPALITHSIVLPVGYDNPDWVRYLSWAELSRTLSLLHPNWPENIFGKTYFMEPLYLLLPLVVIAGLLVDHMGKKTRLTRSVWFFALLLLTGAFLAKGVNPPFGEAYRWLFVHAPLFSGFRDPTKFYLFTVLGYTILIPFALQSLWERYGRRVSRLSERGAMFLCVVGWLVLIGPFVSGKLTGTFASVTMPDEYRQFEALVNGDKVFGRTLVVPWKNRFTYSSESHPAADASSLFGTSDFPKIADLFREATVAATLSRSAIRYVVVPDDSTREIFLTDRTFDASKRNALVAALDALPYLSRRSDYHGLAVYEFGGYRGAAYKLGDGGFLEGVSVVRENNTRSIVRLHESQKPQQFVFAQSYDSHWHAWDGSMDVASTRTSDGFNSFMFPDGRARTVEVYFSSQKLITDWQRVSLLTLGIVVVFMIYAAVKRRSPKVARYCAVVGVLALACVAVMYSNPHRGSLARLDSAFSSDWKQIDDPATGLSLYETTFEGSRMAFDVVGTKEAHVILTGSDVLQGVRTLVTVNGTTIPFPPGDAAENDIVLTGPASGFSVMLTTICSGAPECRLTVRGVRMGANGTFTPKAETMPVVAVVGDSISGMHGESGYGFMLAKALGMRLLNASVIGGTASTTYGFAPGVERIGSVAAVNPDIMVIALGTNDLIRKVPLADFTRDYAAMVSSVVRTTPGTRVYLMGLFPGAGTREMVAAYNTAIRAVAASSHAGYLDAENLVSPSLFQDTLHPGKDAQRRIADALLQLIGKGTK